MGIGDCGLVVDSRLDPNSEIRNPKFGSTETVLGHYSAVDVEKLKSSDSFAGLVWLD